MINFKNLLTYILISPLIGFTILAFIPSSNVKLVKKIGFRTSCVTFVCSIYLWVVFNNSLGTFQLVTENSWISLLNINLNLGVDGISLFFVMLTTFLISLCILTSWNSIAFNMKEYIMAFLLMEFFFNRCLLCVRSTFILRFF